MTRQFLIGFACFFLLETEWRQAKKSPLIKFIDPLGVVRVTKKWFEIVHWVVMNVFEPFNSYMMMYLKLGLT